jgi:glutaredoxin 2
MSSVDSILDVDKFSDWIGLQTTSSKDHLKRKIKEWSHDESHLSKISMRFQRFKKEIKKDPEFYKECNKYFKEIAQCEEELKKLVTTESDLERESYNELLFFRPILKPLNFVSYFLNLSFLF